VFFIFIESNIYNYIVAGMNWYQNSVFRDIKTLHLDGAIVGHLRYASLSHFIPWGNGSPHMKHTPHSRLVNVIRCLLKRAVPAMLIKPLALVGVSLMALRRPTLQSSDPCFISRSVFLISSRLVHATKITASTRCCFKFDLLICIILEGNQTDP
jgi:hypothetical protein